MRRVIILISLTFFLLGCTTDKVSSPNNDLDNNSVIEKPVSKQQHYSFGPIADVSKIDQKTKEELQSKLNSLGDPIRDKLTFYVLDCYYDEDGGLFVDVFIRNGYTYPVFNISATLDIMKGSQIIATAAFDFASEEFGSLSENDSRPWTIYYYPEDIKNKEANLSQAEIHVSNLQYEF